MSRKHRTGCKEMFHLVTMATSYFLGTVIVDEFLILCLCLAHSVPGLSPRKEGRFKLDS
jgi:hypothetical protein